MPPPKKPKIGRTSLEQFLTEEERLNQESSKQPEDGENRRVVSQRDSEGNSPMGSVDTEVSDGEVFDNTKQPRPRADSDNKSNEDQESLFKRLFRKAHSVDEQKVPGSPEQDVPSPTSSPVISTDKDRISAFKLKYEEHMKYISGKREIDNSEFFQTSRHSPQKQTFDRQIKTYDEKEMFDLRMRRCSESRQFSTEHSRLIDTLVASALASKAAQSIIYSSHPVGTQEGSGSTTSSTLQGYRVSSDLKQAYPTDLEPQDLSKRPAMTNSMSNSRFFNLNNNSDRMHAQYSELAYRESTEITLDRNKHYLDTHRHIVGLLSDRDEERRLGCDKSPNHVMEKENIVQNIPARYPNGLYHPSSLNILGGYGRFDQRPSSGYHDMTDHYRNVEGIQIKNEYGGSYLSSPNESGSNVPVASVVKLLQDQPMYIGDSIKGDEGANLMSQGGYLQVHSMMTHGPQAPTSTTLDLVDGSERFHPAFMNPSLMADGRRIKQEHTPHGTAVNKLCQVCNDNASGFHYGVWSCEGCKAFFKRSIQGPVDYVCPATNTCTIDKHRRKSCQACRLRKCYEVGMNKGSQRKDRKSTGSMNGKSPKRPRSESGEGSGISSSSSPTPSKNSRKSRTSLVLEALSKANLPSIESYHNHSVPPSRVHLLNSLVKLAERELVFLINWAKNVPGYTDLTLGDQVHLIECCWMELLLLNCAFRSMENRGRSLVFAPDLILDRPYWSMVGMCEILDQVSAVSEQMVRFQLHKDELLLLQATVLANAEVRRLASYSKLHEIQQTVLDCVVDIAQKYHPNNLRHVPSVLLLLTHIRQAAERATAFFQNVKKEGVVEFCDLLTEMLDAQSEDKKSSIPTSDSSSTSLNTETTMSS